MPPNSYFDAVQAPYEAADTSTTARFWRHHDLNYITTFLPAQRDVLIDLGCGNGFYAAALATAFSRVFAIDLSMPMVAATSRRCITSTPHGRAKVMAICCDMQCVPLATSISASFVLCTGASLCYATDIHRALAQIRTRLQPFGRAYLEFWNRFGLLHAIAARSDMVTLPELTRALATGDQGILQDFLVNGRTVERMSPAAGLGTLVTSYTLQGALALVRATGLRVLAYFGRKALSIFYDSLWIDRRIIHSPEAVATLESQLAHDPDLLEFCPKFVIIAERDDLNV